MNIIEKLVKHKSSSVIIQVNDGKLQIKTNQEMMTDELKLSLKRDKQAILDFYQEADIRSNKQLAPSSFSQQRLWFLDAFEGGSSNYNIPAIYPLPANLNITALRRVLLEIVKRHHSLRTTYIESDGTIYQKINDIVEVPITVHQFSGNEVKQKDDFDSVMQNNEGYIFDLSQDLMIKADLCLLGDKSSYLLVCIHHIASDGWSQILFKKEFQQLYQSFSANLDNPLVPLNFQFTDYAHWERDFLQGEVLQKHHNYWEQKLRGLPDVHSLPLDRVRPKVQTFNGGNYTSYISGDCAAQFKSLCSQNYTSTFIGMSAIFSYFLSRFSGEDDIVFATPIANREQQEMSKVMGFFVNTLILRFDMSTVNSFSELLALSKKTCSEAYEYQQVPFEQIVNRLKLKRSTSYSPVFQIMLGETMQDGADKIRESNEEKNAKPEAEIFKSKFDLSMHFNIIDEEYKLSWNYNSDLFDHETIALMAECYENLLTQVTNSPDKALSAFYLTQQKILPVDKIEQVAPSHIGVHQLLQLQAQNSPNAIALSSGNRKISFAQLNSRSNQLAHWLFEKNLGGNQPIIIYMDNSCEMLPIAIFAILKIGSCFVTLDKQAPLDRVKVIAEQLESKWLLTDSTINGEVGEYTQVIDLNDVLFGEQLDQQLQNNLNIIVSKESLAYISFTSGTTGLPKGVMISHHNLISYMNAANMHYGINDKDKLLQFSSISFDIFVEELFCSICHGATLQLRTVQDKTDIVKLLAFIAEQGTTVISLPTSYFHLLCENTILLTSTINTLRLIIIGGEKLSAKMMRKWRDAPATNRIRVLNTYGPTETTVVASIYDVSQASSYTESIPIGKALDCLQFHVVDRFNHTCPNDFGGELLIAGDSVSRGYFANDKLTAEKFVSLPSISDKVMYRTGDFVKRSPDGNLVFLGRIDEQVKIRGYRIELDEIEHKLNQHDGVESALILALADDYDHKRLVAYIKPAWSLNLESQAQVKFIAVLKKYLADYLPDYMIPSVFSLIRQWPLTVNGKINKKKLPELDWSILQNKYVAPKTNLELQLTEIWSLVLNIPFDKISINSNFFELGGHSLLAVRLVTEIRNRLKQELSIKSIFDSPDIQGLSTLINRGSHLTLRTTVTPVARDGAELPLSFAQQSLWFIDKMNQGSSEYNMPISISLEQEFNVEAAEIAFNRIIQRHEPLRTVFAEGNDGPVQIIQREVEFKLARTDLSLLDKDVQTKQVKILVQAERNKVFDLSVDLMLRCTYLHLSKEGEAPQGLLMLTMHHIASDGWSVDVLLKELWAQYEAILREQPDPFEPLVIQYADYAYWQREWLQGEVLENQLAYWENQLNEVPAAHSLPLDFPRPKVKNYQGASISESISVPLSKQLLQVAQQYQVTPFMLVHGALALLLSRHSNSSDIVIGTPSANRLQAELEPLIGFFINTLVLRVDTDYESFSDYIEQIKTINLNAQANQDVPFESLVERCQILRSTQHTPLIQIMLNMNTNEGVAERRAEKAGEPVENVQWNEAQVAKFDLAVNAQLTEAGGHLSWVYDTSIFTRAHIETLNAHLQRLLAGIAELPNSQLKDLPILSKKEISYLTHELNETQEYYPKDKLIHELFEEQAALSPDNIAIISGDKQLTYGELNERSNQLAYYLREVHDIRPDTLVGLCLDRSIDMVVGMLGILKAGGAYVPLDPAYPEVRLKYMVKDTNISVVLTQEKIKDKVNFGALVAVNLTNSLLDYYSIKNLNHEAMAMTSTNLVYVIYTSGSTGQAKGVMTTHQNITRLVYGSHAYVGISDPLKVLIASPITFDAATFEIWVPLLLGGSAICFTDKRIDIELLNQTIESHGVNLAWLTAGLFDVWVDSEGLEKSTLQTIITGGDVVSGQSVKRLYRRNSTIRVVNGYGPTECATFTCCHSISRDFDSGLPLPIGQPVMNTCIYVLSSQHEVMPLGAIGELHIGGHGVARGYLNQPALTDEKFIHDPFSKELGAVLYKTGDLVRWLPNGMLEFIGRVDDQVKIRGFRIELGEIETQLRECEVLSSSRVLVTEGQGQKALVAYVLPKLNGEIERKGLVSELRRELQINLPDYMMPTSFVVVDEWPLTANGKLNIKALPALDSTLYHKEYIAPSTDIERVLVDIWAKLLKLDPEKISVTANFFELGGHSLLAIQLISKIRDELDFFIQVKDVFNHYTVGNLSSFMETLQSQGNEKVIVSMTYDLDTEFEV